jgi:pilus assembly protein FimV
MQIERLTPFVVLMCLAGFMSVMSPQASALGLGAGPQSVTLGQPLDISINARLEPGETLPPECVQAEVLVGDQRPLPATVSTRLAASGNSAVIRISTTAVVDEPVVTVQLQAGCGARVSRRYVALADPGVTAMQPVVTAPAAPPASALPTVESVLERPAPTALPAATAGSEPAASDTAARSRAATLRAAPPRERTVRRTRAQVRAEARAAARSERAAPRAQARAANPATAAAAPVARSEGAPRLRLESAEAPSAAPPPSTAVIEQAFEAVSQAASAARASAAAASAAAEKIAALERNLERSRAEAKTTQSEVERLRLQLNRPQLAQEWLWPLVAGLGFLLALAAWMAWRLRAMQRTQQVAWARASAVAAAGVPTKETSPLPLMNSEPAGANTPGAKTPAPHEPTTQPPDAATLLARKLKPDPAFDQAMARTVVLPPTAKVEEASPRDVSIEELIDVDQQAEFFIALGQDHAAIDMLVAHLRNTGGGSPLTYLKLLEIYRRVDDQPAYERTRTRFNQRYNAYAPEWGADLTLGKSLEDYEAVVPRLTQAWPRPLDAMAELEALLFRKSRGELFDLPAYRDVLFLYALARDLMDREPSENNPVDLLLPLDAASRAAQHAEGGGGSSGVGNSRASSDMPIDDHPTSPLDLDLTPARSQESIFGEPLQPTPGVRRNGGPSRY